MSQLLNKRMLLMLFGCLLLFGGIFAFKYFGRVMMNRAFDTMPLPPATVTSAVAEVQTWQESLIAVGTMRAVNGVEITTEAQGVVSAIHFKSGQTVDRGQLLAELAAGPEKAQLQVLQAELRLARRNHDRIKALHARGSPLRRTWTIHAARWNRCWPVWKCSARPSTGGASARPSAACWVSVVSTWGRT
ncbi:biotin/lipoyl-binding protein [Microbulbifer taiwanensis]|uniref:biotin/lipoyl-containing protein n=1 Tax=Microbulbifer taiwanensis TaxID=986746 RepID=UPI003612AA9B